MFLQVYMLFYGKSEEMLCSVSKSYRIRTNTRNPSMMISSTLTIVYQQAFAHNTHRLLEGIVCDLIGLLTQFWLLAYLSGITHTLLGPCVCVILAHRKQFISLNYMPYIAHICIWLATSVLHNHRKRVIQVKCMPYIACNCIWLAVSVRLPHHQ
jgi:hypothetical protein